MSGIWRAGTIVFIASFCTLVVELTAGRMIAPYLGVSLYTWTSVIGVMLAGISLGNYIGGRVGDRFPTVSTLGVLFLLSSILTLTILPLTAIISSVAQDLPVHLMLKILFFTAVVFFLPSVFMGTITPVVVRLILDDLSRTGGVVGRIYALSTVGAIAGTFATGFFLVSWFGTRTIILLVAVILLVVALIFGNLWRLRLLLIGGVLLLIGIGIYSYGRNAYSIPFGFSYMQNLARDAVTLQPRGAFAAPCQVETNYFCIRVTEKKLEDDLTQRRLVLDHLIHSYSILEDPTRLDYDYVKIYAELVAYIAGDRTGIRTFSIGGGGYTFPRYLEVVYPDAVIEVAEIDPVVTEIAHEKMGLPRDTSVITYNEDARLVVKRLETGQYDAIIGDAFNDLSVPYHLTTREFAEIVHDLLTPGGYYMLNVVDTYKNGVFLPSLILTLEQVFPHVYLLADGPGWEQEGRNTFVVVAGKQPLSEETLRSEYGDVVPDGLVSTFLDAAILREYVDSSSAVILTDSYAPVDNMLAPVFAQRG
jgi:spermidine synthase